LKKVAATLLSAMLLFNWVGYKVLIYTMEHKASEQLEARLDTNDFDESQLISIKVPAYHLSYYSNSSQFERTNGQVEVNGIQYKYVKKRLFNDSLEFICIPDHSATQLQMAKNDFFKQVNDLQHVGQGKKSNSHAGPSVSFSTDYYINNASLKLNDLSFVIPKRSSSYSTTIPLTFLFAVERPPQAIA
jgi:hypothetical protein